MSVAGSIPLLIYYLVFGTGKKPFAAKQKMCLLRLSMLFFLLPFQDWKYALPNDSFFSFLFLKKPRGKIYYLKLPGYITVYNLEGETYELVAIWKLVFLALWIAGIVTFCIVYVYRYRKMKKTLWNDSEKIGKSGNISYLKNDGYNIDNEVIKYIAMHIKSNIRELEGALNKLVALSNLEKREITVELAEEALKDIVSPDEKKEVTPALIVNTVAEHFHVSVDDIRSNKRNNEIVVPRQIAMYLCNTMTSVGLKKIGSEIGGRDHSTVLHGSKKISDEMKTSDDMRKTIEILQKKISPG